MERNRKGRESQSFNVCMYVFDRHTARHGILAAGVGKGEVVSLPASPTAQQGATRGMILESWDQDLS